MLQPNVLIVDDEPEFLETVAERLANRGFSVETASNGAVALEKIGNQIFDAIVLDLMMPEIDGMETLKRALKKKPDLQIILLTGHATLQTGIEAIKLGALDFMKNRRISTPWPPRSTRAASGASRWTSRVRENAVRAALQKYGW